MDQHGKETIGKVTVSMMSFEVELRLAQHSAIWKQGTTLPCTCCPNFPGKHVFGINLDGAIDYVYNEIRRRLTEEGREKGRFQITIRTADLPPPVFDDDEEDP